MARTSLAARLLVLSVGAGSMNLEVDARLRRAFPDHLVVEFDPKRDLRDLMAPRATVVVAGGDGTVGFVARKLARTPHTLGIVPMGTFNNFARALGIPLDLDGAIRVIGRGRPRPITLGGVNGTVFLETCSVGLFGEIIALGEAAKAGALGDLASALRQGPTKPFRYWLRGDLTGRGTARSLVFTNTPWTGAGIQVGDSTPADPYLEFSVQAFGSRLDILGRFLNGVLRRKRADDRQDQMLEFRRLEVTTRPRVSVYADDAEVGRTPVTITAERDALQVILPA